MDPLATPISALHSEGRLRVWSLVITVFGDAVQHRGGKIAAARLQVLMERLGIGAGALRTALSRLASEGWVERERDGRSSFYRLSARGIAEFETATARIYAAPSRKLAQKWSMAAGADAPLNGVEIFPNLWIIPGDPNLPDHVCVTGKLTSFPDRLRQNTLSGAHRDALCALARDLQAMSPALLTGLDAMAGRTLLLHRWRRIILRHPEIPTRFLPDDCPLMDARAKVAECYSGLCAESEKWLDTPLAGSPALPPASDDFATRFGAANKKAPLGRALS